MPIWTQIPGKVEYPFVMNDASPQADGLVGWWPGAGAGGKMFDMSGRGNHGTLTNFAAPFTATSGWVAGKDGGKGALAFDGTNDYVSITKASVLSAAGAPKSYACWAIWRGTGSYPQLLATDNNGLFAGRNNSVGGGEAGLSWYCGPSAHAGTSVDPPINTWFHAAFVYDGTTPKVYQNGIRVDTSRATGTSNAETTFLSIGEGYANTPWPGLIEDVRKWNRGLSDTEVAALYDPRTRWELRYVPGRVAYYIGTGGGGAASYTLTADAGSYTYSGIAAALKASRQLAAAQGTYTLTGIAAALKAARKIVGDAGGYTLTGIAATLNKGFYLTAGTGSYTLTGIAAALVAARKLAAGTGSYTLTGVAATLNKGFYLTAGAGSYTLSGQDAGLRIARVLVGANGSYTLTGNVATISAGRKLTAETGSITLTGQSAALLVARMLAAGVGTYTVTGNAASIVYSGAGTVEIIITATGYTWRVIDATGYVWTEIDDTE